MPNYRRSRSKGATFFFTVVTHNRQTIFKSIENIRIFRKVVNNVRSELPFEEIACVIMHDHIHSIWRLPKTDNDFSKRWGITKARFTKFLCHRSADFLDKKIWQQRFWEHEIRDVEDLNNHLDYLHYNPVKHSYVDKVSDWPYSSFHRFVADGYYEVDWARGVVINDMGSYGE